MEKLNEVKSQVMKIILDPAKTHRQTVYELAEAAENLCDYPDGVPEDFYRLEKLGILCDHNDGHAPYCPRYILPDYELFMEKGSAFLRLPPPKTLYEALTWLIIFYSNVPSITHAPVYAGRLDKMLEPFLGAVPEDEARSLLRGFLLQIDRSISDSFCHANIGPEASGTGELLLELLAELNQAVPNMTLLYDPDKTPDDFAVKCISTSLQCANPAFALDSVYRKKIGERYGIASCYNGLPIGGGAYSLSRIRLSRAAEYSGSCDRFFERTLPEAVDTACAFMEAKIRFIAEDIPFFRSSFLAGEGFVKRENFLGMFGVVGLHECVNTLMEYQNKKGRYGSSDEANRLGVRIMEEIEDRVNKFESKYCEVSGNRFLLHAQVGAAGDNGVTPGARIAIGEEPPLYDHLRQAGMFHPFFPSGAGDIFPFDRTAAQNPHAVLDIFKGAFQSGMQYISAYSADSDVIRVTGYLIKRSDMEAFQQGEAVANSAVAASRETVEERHTFERKIRSI